MSAHEGFEPEVIFTGHYTGRGKGQEFYCFSHTVCKKNKKSDSSGQDYNVQHVLGVITLPHFPCKTRSHPSILFLLSFLVQCGTVQRLITVKSC